MKVRIISCMDSNDFWYAGLIGAVFTVKSEAGGELYKLEKEMKWIQSHDCVEVEFVEHDIDIKSFDLAAQSESLWR